LSIKNISKCKKRPNDFASWGTVQLIDSDSGKNVIAVADISLAKWFLESKYYLAKFSLQLPSVCPTSLPLDWDIELPLTLPDYIGDVGPWVLKRDGGSGGREVYFVQSMEEIQKLLEEGQLLEQALPFLEERQKEGLIPNWALQKYISNLQLLPYNGHLYKFHVRAYILMVDELYYLHNRPEIRLASTPFVDDVFNDISQHLTNGTQGAMRLLASEFTLLESLTEKLVGFAELVMDPCAEPPSPFTDTTRETGWRTKDVLFTKSTQWKPIGIYAMDLMVDTDMNLWLLEVNHSPSVSI